MFQPDFFKDAADENGRRSTEIAGAGNVAGKSLIRAKQRVAPGQCDMDLPAVLERLAVVSDRPRYTFMVLNLIARAAGQTDSAGPYVREGGQAVPVRDWLSDALLPMAQRDPRRLAVIKHVRADLIAKKVLPADVHLAEQMVSDEVRSRLLHSGRTNVSRAVSDLVRAGLLRRHYQGIRVDHVNRGAQREAVYTIAPAVRRALGKAA